jgi:hypothetical protein
MPGAICSMSKSPKGIRVTSRSEGRRSGGPEIAEPARDTVIVRSYAGRGFIMSWYRIARGAPRDRLRDRLQLAKLFRHEPPFSFVVMMHALNRSDHLTRLATKGDCIRAEGNNRWSSEDPAEGVPA